MRRSTVAALTVFALVTPFTVQAAGDPVRGGKLHEDCLGCHCTELYVAPRAKVKNLSALKNETRRWNDRMNPKFKAQEIDDIVAWLNRDFYKFPK